MRKVVSPTEKSAGDDDGEVVAMGEVDAAL
jgi:hypothetical protein